MFSEYCEVPFTCEPVEVHHPDGSRKTYPNLETHPCYCDVSYANSILGLQLDVQTMIGLLRRMGMRAEERESGRKLCVHVPPTRSDVLHACDVMEDIGIAYGFNNLPVAPPPTVSLAKQNELNRLTDKVCVCVCA